jgi:hypothetical protein
MKLASRLSRLSRLSQQILQIQQIQQILPSKTLAQAHQIRAIPAEAPTPSTF